MYRIIDGRCSGKTSRLMLLAKEHNGIIVCSNPRSFEEKAKSYGIDGISFISYGDFKKNKNIDIERPVFIDEIEGFLNTFNNFNIEGYTLSVED